MMMMIHLLSYSANHAAYNGTTGARSNKLIAQRGLLDQLIVTTILYWNVSQVTPL